MIPNGNFLLGFCLGMFVFWWLWICIRLTSKDKKFLMGEKFSEKAKDYRQAVGAAPGFLGDEKPEDVIRRAR